MQEIHLSLKEAGPSDLPQVARLAGEIWHQHYTPIIGTQQVNYMLNLMYSADSLKEQMLSKQHRFYLIELNGGLAGFISVHREKGNDWFLNKFYILKQEAAKGLGTRVLEEIKDLIEPQQLTLTVNRQNYKSINFYFKNGFVIQRVADFDIGNGYVMNDFVMVWKK